MFWVLISPKPLFKCWRWYYDDCDDCDDNMCCVRVPLVRIPNCDLGLPPGCLCVQSVNMQVTSWSFDYNQIAIQWFRWSDITLTMMAMCDWEWPRSTTWSPLCPKCQHAMMRRRCLQRVYHHHENICEGWNMWCWVFSQFSIIFYIL